MCSYVEVKKMLNKELMGDRLRKLRGNKTLYEVSSQLKITPSALSNYESGLRMPRDEVKCRIAQYYNTSIEDIFFTQ